MAIFHLSAKTVSRSTGRSAVAAAAYRAACQLYDDRTGLTHAFGRKRGVIDSRIIAPAGCDWALDRGQLWNEAERADTRKNSTTAREFVVALPSELSADQRKQLVMAFSRALSDRYCIAVDSAIHAPNSAGDDRNHHAHFLTPTRKVTSNGLGSKLRVLDDMKTGPAEITEIRKIWATLTNKALAEAKCSNRISEKSHATRAAEIEAEIAAIHQQWGGAADTTQMRDKVMLLTSAPPTVHIGPHATAMERKAKAAAKKTGRTYEPATERTKLNQQEIDGRQEIKAALDSVQIMESLLKAATERAEECRQAAAKAARAAAEVEAERLAAEKTATEKAAAEDIAKAKSEADQSVAKAKIEEEREAARIEQERRAVALAKAAHDVAKSRMEREKTAAVLDKAKAEADQAVAKARIEAERLRQAEVMRSNNAGREAEAQRRRTAAEIAGIKPKEEIPELPPAPSTVRSPEARRDVSNVAYLFSGFLVRKPGAKRFARTLGIIPNRFIFMTAAIACKSSQNAPQHRRHRGTGVPPRGPCERQGPRCPRPASGAAGWPALVLPTARMRSSHRQERPQEASAALRQWFPLFLCAWPFCQPWSHPARAWLLYGLAPISRPMTA